MAYEDLVTEIEGGVLCITMDRPETRNVISDEPMRTELVEVATQVNGDPSVRAVILTGRGSAFSAGGNVHKMHEREGPFGEPPPQLVEWYRTGIQRLIRAVYAIEVPTIAAINGHAIGAGFDLALACDLRLCASTAKLGETFVNLGLVPGDGGAWLLPRAVGAQRAAELALTGRVFGAAEAAALGVVLAVHEPDELAGAAHELARAIASKPAMASRWTKRLLRMAERSSLDDVLETTSALQALLHDTPAHRSALAAARPT